MGNWCSSCCRKSHNNLRDDDPYNYGTTNLIHSGGTGRGSNYSSSCPVDAHSVYAQYTTGPVGVNGELKPVRVSVPNAYSKRPRNPLMVVSPIVRHKPNSQTAPNSYVIVTEPSNFTVPSMFTQSSGTNLQHISEREPDDTEGDPSLNPTKETLFMQRSIRDVEASLRKRRSVYDRNISHSRQRTQRLLHRSSSCSTVHLDDSTVTRPDPKSTVRALAYAVYLQIKNRDRHRTNPYVPDIFDERLHPVQNDPVPPDYGSQDPDHKVVYRFIRTLFQMAQLSPECAIVTMVYLERLLTSAETELTPATWKRMILCAILLASKVWDDQAVWNVDYCQILKDLNVNDVNELERQFLEIIQFNINVPSSVYAKYYFDIRSLCSSSCHPFPLSMERAHKLEACSRAMDDTFHEATQRARRRWGSLDTLTCPPPFRSTVLS